ncbi:MAG: tetratricopeptide repeat protein [Bacteroidetes bacterium]|nr:tetratricopeptide repeat protein [Bacteroidota bacterium]
MTDRIEQLERTLADAASDTARAEAMYNLAVALRYVDLGRLSALTRELLDLARAIGDPELLARAYMLRGLCTRDLTVDDYGMADLQRAYDLRRSLEDFDGCAIMVVHMSRIHDRRGNYREALAMLARCNEYIGRIGPGRRTQLYARTAANYTQLGDFGNAHIHVLKALDAAHNGAESADRVNAFAVAGGLYYNLGMFTKARELMLRAMDLVVDDTDRTSLLNNLAAIAGAHEDYGEAIRYFTESVKASTAAGRKYMAGFALGNRAEMYRRMGRKREAMRDARAALAIAEKIGDRNIIAHVCVTLGRLAAEENDVQTGIAHLKRARDLLQAMGQRKALTSIHKLLAGLYRSAGKPKEALEHLECFAAMHDEVFDPKKLEAMADVLDRLELERATQEREILRLKAEQLEREMEHRNARLTALALHLVEKREFLHQIDSRLRAVATTTDNRLRDELAALTREVRQNLSGEEEWDAFEDQFTRVHGAFLEIISTRYPTLTATELKVCALMRINLDTKEIARMLSTSLRTVQNHRYNIRKKLGLEDRVSLGAHLAVVAGGPAPDA